MKHNFLNAILGDKTLITNGAVLSLTFTDIEMVLKIILLLGSIVWTGLKIHQELKQKNKDERKD
jgi:hypothetical protein